MKITKCIIGVLGALWISACAHSTQSRLLSERAWVAQWSGLERDGMLSQRPESFAQSDLVEVVFEGDPEYTQGSRFISDTMSSADEWILLRTESEFELHLFFRDHAGQWFLTSIVSEARLSFRPPTRLEEPQRIEEISGLALPNGLTRQLAPPIRYPPAPVRYVTYHRSSADIRWAVAIEPDAVPEDFANPADQQLVSMLLELRSLTAKR